MSDPFNRISWDFYIDFKDRTWDRLIDHSTEKMRDTRVYLQRSEMIGDVDTIINRVKRPLETHLGMRIWDKR